MVVWAGAWLGGWVRHAQQARVGRAVVHNDFLDFFSPGESKHPVFGKAVDKASFDTMVRAATPAARQTRIAPPPGCQAEGMACA